MRELSFTEALREALTEELRRQPKMFLLGEDIGVYGGAFGVTRGLLEQFGPERIINTPISEPGFVGVAIGAALAGCRPVVAIMFMDFMTLTVDQLVHGQGHEIHEHDFHHRPAAGQGGANGDADKTRFRNGGVDDPLRAELVE